MALGPATGWREREGEQLVQSVRHGHAFSRSQAGLDGQKGVLGPRRIDVLGEHLTPLLHRDNPRGAAIDEPDDVPAEAALDDAARRAGRGERRGPRSELRVEAAGAVPLGDATVRGERVDRLDDHLDAVVRHGLGARHEVPRIDGSAHGRRDGRGHVPRGLFGVRAGLPGPEGDGVDDQHRLGGVDVQPADRAEMVDLVVGRRRLADLGLDPIDGRASPGARHREPHLGPQVEALRARRVREHRVVD